MMNINDEISKLIKNPDISIEVDTRCDSSIMNTNKNINDIMLMAEYVREMEIYVCDLISEINRVNSETSKTVTTNNFCLQTIQELRNIIDKQQTPRIISIYKSKGFEKRERELISKCLSGMYVEDDEYVIYCVNSVEDDYPIDVNRLKLYGVDTRSMRLDYVLLNNESYDILIDKKIGIKKYLLETLDALTYHGKRMEVLYANSLSR